MSTTYLKIDSPLIKKITDDKIFSAGEQQILITSLQCSKRLSRANYNNLIENIMKKNNWM